jgi:hypothetical protein
LRERASVDLQQILRLLVDQARDHVGIELLAQPAEKARRGGDAQRRIEIRSRSSRIRARPSSASTPHVASIAFDSLPRRRRRLPESRQSRCPPDRFSRDEPTI